MQELKHRLERWALLYACAFVLLSYSNALEGGFVWDDHSLINDQKAVTRIAPLSSYFLQMFWSDPLDISRDFYRPLVTLGYALEYQLWDGQPWGFHLANVLYHLAVVCLVYLLARRGGASRRAAGAAAALFGTFPRLTESVTWIAGRTDVTSAGFGLLALWVYSTETGDSAARRRWFAGLLLLCSLWCKEVGGVVLLSVAIQEGFLVRQKQRPWQVAAKHLTPMFLAVLIYGVTRAIAASKLVQLGTPVTYRTPRVLNALAAIGHYGRMIFLDPLRPQTQIGSTDFPLLPYVLGGVFVLILVALWARRNLSRLTPFQLSAVVAGVAALSMVLHLLFLSVNVLAADRFLYMPLAMAAIGLAAPAERWMSRWWNVPTWAGLAVVLLAFGAAVQLRNRLWNDELAFWREAAQGVGPETSLPAMQLGMMLMDEGMYEAALPYLKHSIEHNSRKGSISGHNNLAVCYSRLGRHEEAIAVLLQILENEPKALRARFNLMLSYARLLRFDDAEAQLAIIEGLIPTHPALPEYRALLARSKATWAKLGPPSANEPTAQKLERALFFEDLTASHEAALVWDGVIASPDLSQEQLLKATGTLVFNHDLARAKRAVERLARSYPETPELAGFTEHLAVKERILSSL